MGDWIFAKVTPMKALSQLVSLLIFLLCMVWPADIRAVHDATDNRLAVGEPSIHDVPCPWADPRLHS